MNRFNFCLVLFFCISLTGFTQSNEKNLLMTIDSDSIYVDEFLRIYNKNIDLIQDKSQKSKDAYLELFINYKLKVKEAYAQNLHQNRSFNNELGSYRNQLSQNYLYEQEITEELIEEGYERLLEEVSVSHILLRVTPENRPADTLAIYNRMKEILNKARSGEDFEILAKKYSEEPKADERGGFLGYFKGFGMVYPFETAAYNTPVGQVSDIVRTQYGYHILKVHDRRIAPQEVTVAHIMVSNHGESVTEETALARLNEIIMRINQGEDFGDLARQFSEDPGTARNGGQLNRFGSGRLNAPEFEEKAFALKNPGDISEPVKTNFGWHIIKLVERHPIESLEEMRDDLFNRVKTSDRSKVVVKSVNERIKEKYNYQKINDPRPFFNEFVNDSILQRKWNFNPQELKENKTIFTIGGKDYTYKDFAEFMDVRNKRGRIYSSVDIVVNEYYKEFKEFALDEYFKISLEKDNEEFANLVDEFRNGLLIYDLMQKNIWEPSKADTIGIKNFYNKNKENYRWNTRVNASIASSGNAKIASQIRRMLNRGMSEEAIKTQLNSDTQNNVIFTSGIFELGNSIVPENFKAKKGVSKVLNISTNTNTNSAQYIVVNVEDVLPESYMPLDDVRGRVISDYQIYLENEWMEELRSKYTIQVNKKVLNQ